MLAARPKTINTAKTKIMAVMISIDDKRRKSRNILLSAFIILIMLWIFKLSHPQTSIISTYTSYSSTPNVAVIPEATPPKENGHLSSGKQPKPKPKPADTDALSMDIFSGTVSKKAAVIIETRFRTNLIPLILHFGSVLGYSWPIIIYTSPEAMGQFTASSALKRYLKAKTIQIRLLPQTVLFTNYDSVNQFMTDTWLWENLAPAEHILIFQSDSMLCANAARSVEDFFEYDLVGAPIASAFGKGYNGGLSLRKRSTILRILEEWNWEETKTSGDTFEDQWFFNRMKELEERESEQGIDPDDEGAVNLPSMEVARTFSVETIDYPHPLGVHQVHRWLKDKMVSLDEWCPEYKLCSEEHVNG